MNPRTKEILVHVAYWVALLSQVITEIIGK